MCHKRYALAAVCLLWLSPVRSRVCVYLCMCVRACICVCMCQEVCSATLSLLLSCCLPGALFACVLCVCGMCLCLVDPSVSALGHHIMSILIVKSQGHPCTPSVCLSRYISPPLSPSLPSCFPPSLPPSPALFLSFFSSFSLSLSLSFSLTLTIYRHTGQPTSAFAT